MKTLGIPLSACGILLLFCIGLGWPLSAQEQAPPPAKPLPPSTSSSKPVPAPAPAVDRQEGAAKQPADKPAHPRVVSQTVLTVQGTRFAINGRPAFLYGMSYYGALGAADDIIRKDLKTLDRRGFNWVRIWANWSAFDNDVAVVDPEGNPREERLQRLKWLVAECDRRRMVVDITLSRGNGVSGPPRLPSVEAHWRAVEAITLTLQPYRNWYWDLSNERNIRDTRFTSFSDLRMLRQRLRKLDPKRLVTASHAGDIKEDDLRAYVRVVRVDFITPHRPRHPGSPGQTESQTQAYLTATKELGRLLPVHYQEPFRRGFGKWNPTAADYEKDATAAKAGSAAGWCFHNGDERHAPDGQPRRSFDLREKGLFEQLDAEEIKALRLLDKQMREKE